ncbi:hypothetical protein [Brevundimonas sp.]|uniref:hypothetical protein n=1 Tax=Brevundimonas sp. TaxID=1871086 RepID=UPI001A24BD77|nr:hypothetical protein [Brevundimonas sp.]MBJ7483453.1 glycosyltransferase [Brevundimonas sp.]
MKVLSLGTYPIRLPVHGGQRRTTQIGLCYERAGIQYLYASVYSATTYSPEKVTERDYPYSSIGGIYSDVPFIEDMGSGAFAASQSGPYRHFRSLIECFQPDAVQIEQPFMWPLVRKLREEGVLTDTSLIYSSHNFEAPLKRDILEGVGVDRKLVNRVETMVLDIETELAEQADLLFCVSAADAQSYRGLNPACKPLVVRNGSERPGKAKRPPHGAVFKANEYLYFVGSAYPPNIQGFEKYVLSGGLYGFPPEKMFAICGGASDGIYQSGLYQPHAEAYGDRTHFFPHPSDAELSWLRENAKGILLPIGAGGGSNLKTAEALSSGKWVVATSVAMRSFEDHQGDAGVIVASSPREFQQAMLDVVYGKPLSLTAKQRTQREGLFWDRVFDDSGLADRVLSLDAATAGGEPA